MSAYEVSTGDLFPSTVSCDSALTFKHSCFYKSICSRLTIHSRSATKVFSFRLATPVLFVFVRYFRSLISRPSISFLISMCQDHLVYWPVNLSLLSNFRKHVSSLSIKLLATKASAIWIKKSICPIPIYRQCNTNSPKLQNWSNTIRCILVSYQYPFWGKGLLLCRHAVNVFCRGVNSPCQEGGDFNVKYISTHCSQTFSHFSLLSCAPIYFSKFSKTFFESTKQIRSSRHWAATL